MPMDVKLEQLMLRNVKDLSPGNKPYFINNVASNLHFLVIVLE